MVAKSNSKCGEIVLTPVELHATNQNILHEKGGSDKDEPKPSKKFSRKQITYLFLLFFAAFVDYAAMSLMAPFYPTESSSKGMSETTAGLVFSFYAFVIFVSSPLYGVMIPKFGVKLIYVLGLIISGVSNIVFGALHYVNDYYLFTVLSFIIRGIGAIGCSATINAEFVLISTLFPNHGGYVRGLLETFVGLGLGTGPAIGGLLFTIGGFGLSFYTVGCLMLLNVLASVFLLPNTKESQLKRQKGSLKLVLKLPQIIIGCLTVIVSSATWSFLDPTLEPHLRKFELSPVNLGLVFLLPAALYGICSPIWGKVTDKLTSYWCLMAIGLLLNGFSLLFLGPSTFLSFITDSIWLNIVTLAFMGFFTAMDLMPTYQSILDGALNGGLEENEITHSLVTSLWTSSYSLGDIIGPALGGAILDYWSFSAATSVMSILNVTLSLVSFAYFLNRSKK